MNRGFVKVWRKTRDTGLNCVQLGLWTSCLLESAHKPRTVFVASQQVELQAGQFVFGRSEWARRLGLSDKTLRSALAALIKRGMISASTRASKFTVYSVVNWALYQVCEHCEGPADGPTQGPAEGQQRASRGPHIKNIENLENGEKEDNNTPPVGVIVSKPKRERIRFTPPTVSEVSEYVLSRQSTVDPDAFVAFYESKGWMIGKNRVKDWRACVRTWEANDKKRGVTKPSIDTSWHAYRDWSTRYLTRRRAILPDDTPEPTQDIVDSGAKVLAEYITPDGFSEDEAGRIISWILSRPERAAHVPTLANLADEVPGWGLLISWASNGSRGLDVGDDPRMWRKTANG